VRGGLGAAGGDLGVLELRVERAVAELGLDLGDHLLRRRALLGRVRVDPVAILNGPRRCVSARAAAAAAAGGGQRVTPACRGRCQPGS
jgi:hypothetical protein